MPEAQIVSHRHMVSSDRWYSIHEWIGPSTAPVLISRRMFVLCPDLLDRLPWPLTFIQHRPEYDADEYMRTDNGRWLLAMQARAVCWLAPLFWMIAARLILTASIWGIGWCPPGEPIGWHCLRNRRSGVTRVNYLLVYWRYFWYVARHKWFVFCAACRLGIPWLGLIHDLSKFLPDEFLPYADHFYGRRIGTQRDATGYYKPTDTGDPAFDFAWSLHLKRNRHHWQWWCQVYDEQCACAKDPLTVSSTGITQEASRCGSIITSQVQNVAGAVASHAPALPMPDCYRREMLADWRGAGLAQGTPNTAAWYEKNKDRMTLHTETRQWIEEQLGFVSAVPTFPQNETGDSIA